MRAVASANRAIATLADARLRDSRSKDIFVTSARSLPARYDRQGHDKKRSPPLRARLSLSRARRRAEFVETDPARRSW